MIPVEKITNCSMIRTKQDDRSPITIYPREVVFEGISSNGYYEIDMFIRNQSREIQKLRIINPKTKQFKVKCEQGCLKSLAPGLTLKISVFFRCEKLAGQKQFSDAFYVCGDNFKESVLLKAFPNREIIDIPAVFNVGRLLTIYDNLRSIPIKNNGKIPVDLNCQSQSTHVSLKYNLHLEPSSSTNLEIKLKNKKSGPLVQTIKFSNGSICQLRGIFVEEATQFFSEEGEKLMMIDIGPVFVGERVEYNFVMLNNSEKRVESIFKTFSRNMEISDIKVDIDRGNFIIKAAPNDYAKQLKNCFSSVKIQKVSVQPFGQFQNKVIIYEAPNSDAMKRFQNYAMGQFQEEIEEHPIIQTLIIHSNQTKHLIKVPIKFISVFPRLKISSSVLQYGEVKERTDACQQLIIVNEGDRDIPLLIEHPHIIRVEGQMTIKGHHSEKYKVYLRSVRAGKISDMILFKLFEGLVLEVKVFATCRSASIRAKKYNSSSSRELKGKNELYLTLLSSNSNYQNESSSYFNATSCNRTDYLGDIRTARLNKLLKENIQTEKQPRLKSPHPNFEQGKIFMSQTQSKNAFIKKFSKDSSNKLPLKDIAKFNRHLNVGEIENIFVSESQINFGNIFVDSLASRTIKVTNRNYEPILFQFDVGKNQTLRETNCQAGVVQAFSSREFTIKFKPNSLGTVFLPLQYIINRNHTFELTLTAYVTLVNLDLSTKIVEIGFTTDDPSFQKFQEIELNNRGNTSIKCLARFIQGKHFYVTSKMIELSPNAKKKLKVNYRPVEGEESGLERIDMDKLMIKVVGGAENTIKCIGAVTDAKITVKQSQVSCIGQIVSLPFTGKINIKNHAKTDSLYKIQIPSELAEVISFDKESNILGGEEKRQIVFTILCPAVKKISSYFTFCVRGGKTTNIPVQCSFVVPQILSSKEIIDFGNIPIMGNNYQELISLTNLHKNELKFQLSKNADCQDYLIEIRQVIKIKNQDEFSEAEIKLKKKTTREQNKQKKGQFGQKIFKLVPNVQTFLEVRFIPRKIQQFQVLFPLKLFGTVNFQVEPVPVKLQCSSIEPVVYLHPQKLSFETRIIGESRASYMKSFEIRNPHDYNIDWRIQVIETEKSGSFYISETKGHLQTHQSVNIEVIFKPEQEGYFFEKYDVILHYKKTSHISLQFQGHAVFPCLKFNCNEVLMPVVPLRVQSRSFVALQNHGYDAITISKWKTSSHFPMVDITLNFIQGKLLSLAKKNLKVEIICSSQHPISFTTMLEFYDEFGTKYEVPLSCTFQNCLMTTYSFLEDESSKEIVYDRKQNIVKMLPFVPTSYQNSQNVSAKDVVGCQFIRNWLNYQLNFSIKKFPNCFIQSQGDLFFKFVNKIAGGDLLRKFQRSSTDLSLNLYSYYSDCIRVLKTEGAFLNQIRPQFLLGYKDYKTYINSKNLILQTENDFQLVSIKAWTALFYQLCKLFIMNSITEKLVSKFAQNNTPLNSTVYSVQQLLLFRFLNSFLTDEPIYNFNNQIKIFEILQKSLQKTFNLNLSSSLQALKVSVTILAPTLFIVLASKFLHEQLKQYSLSLFLSQTDLYTIGSKQFMLFLVSYISMLYHYTSPTLICFDASIGDRVTKIIDIENPTNRKAKYKVKLQGSDQFQLEQNQLSLACKSKSQIRVMYQCKQKKEEQGRLYLIPIKQDNGNACIQPLSFKLTTSIISKITLKKIQITANLYEVTTVTLQAELPIDISQLVEFVVSVSNQDEQSPSFFCFQQMTRTLKSNHDKLDLKLVPFSLGNKYCKVCYRSAVYGQFNFEIMAKIEPSMMLKEIRLKQLKVNKDEMVSIYIPKENEQLSVALRFLSDHHIKLSDTNVTTRRTIPANKYTLSIVQSSYIAICDECTQIPRVQLQGKQVMQVNLKCSFGKPFAEYSCTLMLKNDVLKDVRYYKLVTSIAMKPRIIPMIIRCRARENAIAKIPIKIAPCDLTFQNAADQFSIANFSPHFKQNVDLVGTFSPDWVMKKEVSLLVENHQTLQQEIYQITLIADQPACFDSVKLYGSAVFSKAAKIPLIMHLSGEFKVVCNSNRIKIQGDSKFLFSKKCLNVTVLPDCADQVTSIKFYKESTNHYYWISVSVVNPKIELFKSVSMEEVPNGCKTVVLDDLELSNDHQIYCREREFFKHSVVKKNGKNLLSFEFRPNKQMQVTQKIYLFNNQKQYELDVMCKSPQLPQIVLPEITSTNMGIKTSTINLINYSNNKGNYKASIRPQGIFNLQHFDFQLRGKEKKQIKIIFTPACLLTRYDGLLRFESDTLPTYQYNFSAISQFSQAQKSVECECFTDKDTLKDIYFTNYFAKTEDFIIETQFKNTPFELVQPQGRKFSLQAGSSKRMIVKAKSSLKKQNLNGRLTIRIGQKTWTYNIIPLQIKNFMNKKIVWNCTARQICYDVIDLPENIKVKSIESAPEISPYLTFSAMEETNQLKLKYNPLKPLSKQQYQILLITDSSKYVIHCTISVALAQFDDIIFIKTKEINEVGCVSFKLTNIKKISASFKIFFLKGSADFTVDTEKNVLEPYGRIGTNIFVKFTSHVFNKKVQDELWVETSEMLWRFKVKGMLSKVLTIK